MSTIEKSGNLLEFSHNSWIQKVIYNPDTKRMTVNTRKDSYELQNVSMSEFEDFANSDSKGRHYNEYFKGNPKFAHEYFL